MVEVGKADRTVQFVHAMRLTPLRYDVEQGVAYLHVVDEIEPTEAHLPDVPVLVGTTIDDAGNTSYGFPVAIGHPQLMVTDLQGRVLLGVEAVQLVEEDRRTVILAVLIQPIGEFDELA